jgi:hypothetical protein
MKFLVLGLPRSRTGWLSVFLSTDSTLCLHEGIEGCSSMEEYKSKTLEKADSNTGLMLFDIRRHFPDTKIIIIDGTVEDSVKYGLDTYGLDVTSAMIEGKKRLDALDGLHIKFEDINERLQDMWEYVYDTPYDKTRSDELVKLDIQMRDVHSMDIDAMNALITSEMNEVTS